METGTASEGSAIRTVMVLGRPLARPVGVDLETPFCPRLSRNVWRNQGRHGGPRESRTPADGVFVGCQQGFNKRLMAEAAVQRPACQRFTFRIKLLSRNATTSAKGCGAPLRA